ncbi:MAG TPA: Slp family lipoprotein [Nitrospira sp.]|jgi:outer membrane lipoprotein|nr:Slp family lipoprotein [Nitrospira sp.]
MRRTLLFGFCLIFTGCATSQDGADGSSANRVTFGQVKAAPDSYRGQSVVFGGEVLSARRLKDATRIEVLQLPLDRLDRPATDRTQSQGRFIAMQREFLDPATIPPGTRLTVTGEVTGAMTLPLDETEYTYPVIEARHIEVLPPEMAELSTRPYPYYSGYGPYWAPYGAPYWRPWPYRW